MADRVLRDHSEPCEHGHQLTHFVADIHDDERADDPCPGGREVTVNRLAAILRLPEVVDIEGRYVKTWGEIVDLVVDAALGNP